MGRSKKRLSRRKTGGGKVSLLGAPFTAAEQRDILARNEAARRLQYALQRSRETAALESQQRAAAAGEVREENAAVAPVADEDGDYQKFKENLEDVEQNPCRHGGTADQNAVFSLYRCPGCDGRDDAVSREPIELGVCADKQCYDYKGLVPWLRNRNTLPHSDSHLTQAGWTAAARRPPPNPEAKNSCRLSAEKTKQIRRLFREKKEEEEIDAHAPRPQQRGLFGKLLHGLGLRQGGRRKKKTRRKVHRQAKKTKRRRHRRPKTTRKRRKRRRRRTTTRRRRA